MSRIRRWLNPNNRFTIKSMFRILSGYGEIVHISPRTYSKRTWRLATAYFYVEKT